MPPLATIRAGNVIGGGDWGQNRLIPDLMRACAANQSAAIRNPDSVRPWQDILDCLAAYLRVSQMHLDSGTEPFGSYNVGPNAGDGLPVTEVAEAAVATFGRGTWHKIAADAAMPETPALFLDSTRARETLGWRPRTSSLEAVERAAEWYRRLEDGRSAVDICRKSLAAYRDWALLGPDQPVPEPAKESDSRRARSPAASNPSRAR